MFYDAFSCVLPVEVISVEEEDSSCRRSATCRNIFTGEELVGDVDSLQCRTAIDVGESMVQYLLDNVLTTTCMVVPIL